MPEATQGALARAAVIGQRFLLESLSWLIDRPMADLLETLWPAIERGLIWPAGDGWETPRGSAVSEEDLARGRPTFAFVHDRVHAAANERLSPDEAAELHLRVAERDSPINGDDDSSFARAEHYVAAADAAHTSAQRLAATACVLSAARRALASGAGHSASRFARWVLERLEDEHWDVDGSQLAAVRVTAARALFADGNPLEAEALLARVAEDAPSPVELCLATTCLVNQRTVVGDLGGALAAGLSVLNALGIEVARGEALAARADAVEDALAEVGDISRLPEAEAPLPTAIAALLQAMVPASFFTDQELFTFAVRELVLLTCEHGVTPGSAYPLAFCGFMQAESGNPDAGRRLAEQAIVLSEGRDEPGFLCQVLFTFAHHINHWGAPVFNNVALFRAAERAGMEAGDHQWAGYAMTGLLLNLPSAARSLGEIIDECRRVIPFLKETRNDPMLAMARPVRQFARWLRGETEHEMSDAGFDADAFEAEIEATPKFVATHANLMLHGHAILGEWQEAWSRAEQLADLIQFQRGNYAVAEFELFRGIAAAERQNRELTEACAQRLRGWAERAPENFEPMALLLDGEIARLAGDAWAAMIALDGAARRAREFGHTSICALAHERAAILLDGQGLVAAAEGHALRARSAYALWGATAKVARLDEAWAPVRTPTGIHDYDATRSEDSGTDSSTGQNTIRSDVDLRNLETAGRAIANEVELLALVPRLLRVLMDVSGATRSVLLLPDDDGQLDVVAQLDGTAFERVREPLLTTKLVPRAAVERVAKWDRTRQTGDEPDTAHLVVGSALDHTWLKDDPCVAAYGVRALACVRAERGGRLIAVVYLENNLLAWAFTPERVGILHLLAAQIAAALENAVLLDRLRRETAERLRTQEQLEASQRMESIGRLAAGVAHDFNNLLNVILGWSDTLLGEAPEGEPLHEPLAQIDRAARRGAELT